MYVYCYLRHITNLTTKKEKLVYILDCVEEDTTRDIQMRNIIEVLNTAKYGLL